MSIKKIPIHIFILGALVLGAIFGGIFPVNHRLFKIELSNAETRKIENWVKTTVIHPDLKEKSIIIKKEFDRDDQIPIIKYFKKLAKEQQRAAKLQIIQGNKDTLNIIKIKDIYKAGTPATAIKPIGEIFIRLLSFLAIPLVLASLILGAASLGDVKKLGRIGSKAFILFMSTTAIAITIGLIAANLISPGTRVSEESKKRLLGEYQYETTEKITENIDVDIIDFFVEIVPRNPLNAMANGNMLQIVFFAVMFGITLTFIDKNKSGPVIGFFDGMSETMIKMVDFIMLIAPFGVFALIAGTIADFGFGIISTLIWYIMTVLIGLFLQMLIVYPFLVKFFGKMSPLKFYKGMRNAQIIAFSTSSSAATLPVNFECTKNLGVPKSISSFVLPLGATINMDGTALYQGVATIFIAQVYGFNLGIAAQLTIILTAILASIGTAPVPGVGIIMLIMILQAVHVPPEGIALIIGVDRFLDMCRTIPNITGDAAVAISIAGTEGVLEKT